MAFGNIFVMFLVMATLWMSAIVLLNIFTPYYIIFGIIASAICSLLAYRMRCFNKRSKMLFLHIGFYRHFILFFNEVIFGHFKLAFKFLSLRKLKIDPTLDFILIDKDDDEDISIYIDSINLISGVICIAVRKRHLLIHSLHPSFISRLDMHILSKRTNKVPDDSLI